MQLSLAILFIVLYLYLRKRNKDNNFKCKWCKKQFKYDSVYCPSCRLDDEGMTIERKELNELKQQYKELNDKFTRLGVLAEYFKNKHR